MTEEPQISDVSCETVAPRVGEEEQLFSNGMSFSHPQIQPTEARGVPSSFTHPKSGRPPFPYEQSDPETFARCRKTMRHAPDAKYTYFMRDRRNGLIKIGVALDPHERRARLSSSGFHDMEILLVLRDGCLEGCYHQHFADLCVGGEWFEPHPDLLAEIARLAP